MSKSRWVMIALCFAATAVNYIDRANLGVAVPFIQQDLHISSTAMGLILGAFFWTYAAMQMPAGWLIDRFGERRIYAGVVAWWSLCTMLTAGMKSVSGLVFIRLLLGVGESGGYPANAKVAGRWFPVHERGIASSIFDSGSRVGAALALPIVTAIVGMLGWRASFVISGGLGFVWIVVWLLVYRHPNAQEEAFVASGSPADTARGQHSASSSPKIGWLDLFRFRTIWGCMIGFFCLNFANYFFVTWFPTYLIQARGFSLPHLGTFGTLPALCAIPGGYLGGYLSDRLIRAGWSVTTARKICLVGGMLTSSSIALAAFVESSTAAMALFCLSYSAIAFTGANIWSLPADVAPSKEFVASIAGIQNFAANLAGICIATFTGLMVSLTHGSFVVPLVVGGIICLIGAASYLFVLGDIEPLKLKPSNPPFEGQTQTP
ncbi:Sugar phosphate permease [Paraburkholderia fungorum]|uniref:Sugar phosphate permease n=1 Tax=Paraburkholderia fungorum TaxID=134537 RepID=A0A1H1JNQ6_9BURK|nr:MFS transporter [Paraburkholderia fungorum]SDR51646.1 Sugar phosphate permease [Paraburkholderia fungorum]